MSPATKKRIAGDLPHLTVEDEAKGDGRLEIVAVRLEIPRVPIPVFNLNRHWSRRRREREEWALLIRTYSRGLQRATLAAWGTGSKVRMSVEIHRARFFDEDNLVGCLKPIPDALKQLGYIVDDKPQFFELGTVRQVKCAGKDAHTIITIEAIS